MLEAMQKRDEGLDSTVAATMQYMITMGQLQHVPHKPLIFQQRVTEFRPRPRYTRAASFTRIPIY